MFSISEPITEMKNSYLYFTLIFSVSFGICNGLCYTIPLKICWDHFPNQRGMVSGIIICGFGLGSFIFGIISTILFNPNNIKPSILINKDTSILLFDNKIS
jgi:OFA family oxalate/formate antiporter-like MFS transporter